ncbi:hypothetical protein D3C71_1681490 [compost metagenome]
MVLLHLRRGDGACEDDGAAVAHQWQGLCDAEEDGARVGAELGVIAVDADGRRRLDVVHAGVGHVDVDGAEPLAEFGHHAVVRR